MTATTLEMLLVAELGEIKLSHLCLIAESESSSELASKCDPYPVLQRFIKLWGKLESQTIYDGRRVRALLADALVDTVNTRIGNLQAALDESRTVQLELVGVLASRNKQTHRKRK